jgi:hypothetical protein
MNPDTTLSYWLIMDGGPWLEPIIVCAKRIECNGDRMDAPLYTFAPVAATMSLSVRDEVDSIGSSELARLRAGGRAIELLLQTDFAQPA